MSFKSYRSTDDLEELGVLALTGEACGIGMRVLCDLTQEGVDLIREFMKVDVFDDAWNSKGIKSIMLPYSMLEDLWLYGQVRNGALTVFRGGHVWLREWETIKIGDEEVEVPIKSWVPTAMSCTEEKDVEKIHMHLESRGFFVERWYKRNQIKPTLDEPHAFTEALTECLTGETNE